MGKSPVLDILRDPNLIKIRARAEQGPLLWEDFLSMEMPRGFSPESTWEILVALRQQTAVFFPFENVENKKGWFSVTEELREILNHIDRRSHSGSWLDTLIRSHNVVFLLTGSIIENFESAFQEDGLDFGYETIREMLFGTKTPSTPEETLLHNTSKLFLHDPAPFVNTPCTPETINALYELVTKGVPQFDSRKLTTDRGVWVDAEMHKEDTLRVVSEMIEGLNLHPAYHPIQVAMTVFYLFTSQHPFPYANGAMSLLMTNIYFRKHNLPVLSYIPVFKIERGWRFGYVQPTEGPGRWAEVLDDSSGHVDFTNSVTVHARLVRDELDALEARLREVLKKSKDVSSSLQHDPDINHRQRAILFAALRDPESVFTIRSHQRQFQVAYPTARTDLYKLVEMGYLRYFCQGRTFLFSATSDLKNRFESD